MSGLVTMGGQPGVPGSCRRGLSLKRRLSRLTWALALTLTCSLWGAAGAGAAVTHHFLSSLSEAPVGTVLEEPVAVAVDHATGAVFVGDAGTGMVDVYSSAGVFETQFGEELEPAGIAVDEATGDVYVAAPFEHAVLAYRPDGKGGYQLLSEWFGAGTPAKALGEVTGVAFDNGKGGSDPAAGDLYVVESESTDTAAGVVDVFKPKPNPGGSEEGEGEEGEFVGRLGGPKLEEPNGVAVDAATGRVLVADSGKGFIAAFNDAGVFEEKLTGKGQPFGSFRGKEEEEENIAGIAVDEASGDVYVAEAEHHAIGQYSSTGEWLGWSTTAAGGAGLLEPRGVALTGAGDLYGADSGAGLVDLFGPGVVVPDVTTGKASKLARTTAILSGTINGDGKPAKYSFQWGVTEALGQSTSQQSSGGGEEKVSFTLAELHAGTTYFFRIVGENENGANFGTLHEFTTPEAVEGLTTGPVEELQPTSATLTGSLKRGGFETHYYFQWGTSTAYGKTSPETPAEVPPAKEEKEEKEARVLETGLSGLVPNTTYHYRLVAENSFGVSHGADQVFTTSGPPRITSESTSAIGHEEATIHAKVDPDQLSTTYHFEYGESTAYGAEVPLGGQNIGAGSAPVPVLAALTKLKLGVTYHFRVVAENSAGTTFEPDQHFTTVPPALIDATFATEVGVSEGTLHTQINPLGHDTTYYFQYGTQSCQANPGACVDIPAAPGEDVGAGEGDVAKSVRLTGLAAHTTYYYHVLARNSLGTSEGPERTLVTQQESGAFALPDGRAWELVSPVDKHGAPIEALTREGGLILAAEDGSSLAYVANGSISEEPQGNRSPEMQQVISTRTAQRWESQDIATPNSRAYGVAPGAPQEYQFFTPKLSLALVEPFGPEPPLSPEATQKTIYIRDNASGSFEPLVTEANVPAGTQFGGQIEIASAAPDLTHVLIQSKVALAEAPAGKGLYEWEAGKLRFVSVLPNGEPALASSLGFGGRVVAHAISNDGARVIWEDKAEGTTQSHLYMRDTAKGETVQLDAAQGAPEPEKGSAQFQTASADGSRVFFTDKQRLTADATTEPVLGKPDLYECAMAEIAGKLTCQLKDLTVDHGEGEHAAVQGLLLGAGEEGSSVYFVAQGVLASNENGARERAEAGKDNLYGLHESAGEWTTTFIAGLSNEDSPEWEGNKGAGQANLAFVTARVSPNGRYLAFMSAASPTGYDNTDQHSGKHDEEVYLYDSGSASLSCASCNPAGTRPVGVLDTVESGEGLGLVVDRRKVWAESGHEHWLAGNIPGWTAQSIGSAVFQSRYLSDNGRLFFNSPDDLVPQATNGRENVYEYEPSGLGSCQSPSGACVSLLSAGSSPKESAFLEATPSGNDVFFLTASQLLTQDTDTAFDVYDARVCTQGSPCQTPGEPAEPGCSSADACRPAQPAQPIPATGSATGAISGPGNVSPPPPPPKHEAEAKKTSKPLTRAQKLQKALAVCRTHHPHSRSKRRACERVARKRYGVAHKAKKSARKQLKGKPSNAARSR